MALFWMVSGRRLEAGCGGICKGEFVLRNELTKELKMTSIQMELFKNASPIAEKKIRQARAMQAAEVRDMVRQAVKAITAKFRRIDDMRSRDAH